jgi:AAA+ ATPase superfamily predicted ATPase
MEPFVARSQELDMLNTYHQRDRAELLIVFGRRRVGKTRLLTHWLSHYEVGHALYWVAQPTSATDQLRQFSQAIYRFANQESPNLATFTFESWDQALEQVAALAEEKRFTLIIDEFTYLLGRTPELAGVFQNMWDHLLQQRNILLILSGSHLGMMRKQVLAYQSPLYGRASAQFHIQPLPFGVTAAYFPTYSAAERIAIYAIFGGIPAYWRRIDPKRSISENIRHELLVPNNLMQAEPRLLLQDFVREPDNYIAMLNAIANGYRTQKEIMRFSGLAQGHVSSYLALLEDSGFVERRIPVTAGPRSRLSRYHITDPYLRFYYRFLSPYLTQLALGVDTSVLNVIKRHLLDFIGTHTWEEVCREWVLRAGGKEGLPFIPDRVGSYWDKDAQIDVVGINRMDKTIVLGECKWSPKVTKTSVMEELIKKTDSVVPKDGHWKVLHIGFARGGWSEEATLWAASDREVQGSNWKAIAPMLVDLETIDADLESWSRHEPFS